jgi:hypothetical protein
MRGLRRETTDNEGQQDGVRLEEWHKELDIKLAQLEEDEELDIFAKDIERAVEEEMLRKRPREEPNEEDLWFAKLQKRLIHLEGEEELFNLAKEIEGC